MPLIESGSDEARQKNIEEMIKAGHSPDQAAAAAYAIQRKYKEKKNMAEHRNADTNFEGMSHMQRDKYMQGLSDVGLQALMDSTDIDQEIKDLAKKHVDDRAAKKEEEMMAAGGGGAKGKENVRPDTLRDRVNRGRERYSKTNKVERSRAEDLFEQYAKESGTEDFQDQPDKLTPQAISHWLKIKGITSQGDIDAIIGIWKNMFMPH